MEYRYRPEGVCSREFVIDIDEKTRKINKLKIIGGCPGNTIGVSTLVEGMDIDQVIEKLKGKICQNKCKIFPVIFCYYCYKLIVAFM